MAESSWPEDVAIGCCNLVANKYLLTVYLSHYIVHFFPTSSPKPVHPCLVFHTSVLFSTESGALATSSRMLLGDIKQP